MTWFKVSSLHFLRYGSFIRHGGSYLGRTESLSLMHNYRSLTLTGTLPANVGLTLHNSSKRCVNVDSEESFATKHGSCNWSVPTVSYDIIHKAGQIRSFSTCVRLEYNINRKHVHTSNRQTPKAATDRLKSQHVVVNTSTGSSGSRTSRPRRVKAALITRILLSDANATSDEQVSSIDRRYEEIDSMLESADPDNDETALSDSDLSDEETAALDNEDIADKIEYVEEIDIGIDRDFENDETEEVSQKNEGYATYGGIPDPTVPISSTPCSGCGALLHCQNTSIPGYMPSQRFLHYTKHNPHKLRLQTCQRCYLMNTHNIALNVSVMPDEYKDIIAQVKTVQALVIVVVDVMDMPNSIFPDITRLIGKKRPLYVVGNKTDLLPQDSEGYLRRVKEVLLQQCEEAGLTTHSYIKHVALVSAKTGFGIEELVTRLLTDWARKGHVYILGCTNAGKSSLFNALLSSDMCKSAAADFINRATTSIWPGTTLNLLRFPLSNPEPWKMARRTNRLKRQKTAEEEEHQFLRMKVKAEGVSGRAKYPTLMGHIGKTFEGTQNVAVGEVDSKGWSGPTFTFDDDTGSLVASGKVNLDQMQGFVYDETQFSLSRWCHDTPGVVSDNQILTELTQHELSVVLSQRTVVPRSFILKPGQAMHISGLARIDYITGPKSVYFTVFTARAVPIAVREIFEMDAFYERHVGTRVMGVPLGDAERLARLPALEGKNMTLTGDSWKCSVADIILSSVGWVAVTPGPGLYADIRAYTPGGRGCTLRTPALLPYAINLRGKRTRSAAYQIKPLRLFNSY